jgi:hypothetical protein
MTDSTLRRIAMSYAFTHEQVLKVVDGLNDRQVMWRPSKTAPCIGFHLWHLAR